MTKKCATCKHKTKPKKCSSDWHYPATMHCMAKKKNRIRQIWKDCELWEEGKVV